MDGASESESANPATKSSRRSLWRGSDYGWWFVTDTSGALGGGIMDFALPLVALAITASPAQASTTRAVLLVASAVLSIPGGIVIDRYDRRRLLVIWGVGGFVIYAAAAALGAAGLLVFPVLLVVAALIGARSGLLGGTSNVMLRGVVADRDLPEAMSLNQGRDAVLELSGSPLGGALMQLDRYAPFWASGLLNLLAACTALRVRRYWRRDPKAGESTEGTETDPVPRWRDAFAGLGWVLRVPFQRKAVLASALLMAAFNAFILITIMDIVSAGTNAAVAGLLNTAVGLGMLSGAMISAALVNRLPGGAIVVAFFGCATVSVAGAALSAPFAAKLAFLVFGLLALPAGSAAIGGFQAMLIGRDKLGRTYAGIGLIEDVVSPAMTLLAGFGLQYLGYLPTALGLAGICVIATAIALTMRALITLPKPDDWERHIEDTGLERF